MLSSLHRLALAAIALGCMVPVFALTEVTMKNGTISRGTIVSEEQDFIVLKVDGNDVTIPRSMIQEMRNDEATAVAPVSSPTTSAVPPSLSSETETGTAPSGETSGAADAALGQSQTIVAPIENSISAENSVPVEVGSRLGRESRERVSVGLDLYWNIISRFNNNYQSNTEDHRVSNDLTLKPYVGIRISDVFEIRPALLFSRSSISYDYEYGTGSSNYSSTSSSGLIESTDSSASRLGFDFGCFFYPIRGGFFRFALGPALGFDMSFTPRSVRTYSNSTTEMKTEYDTYIDLNVPLHVPFNLDFVPSRHLGFRLSSELFGVRLNVHYVKMPGSTGAENSVVTTTTNFDLTKTLLDFGAGMFLLF